MGIATLDLEIQGYAVKPRVNFKITAKPTPPKFRTSAKSVTLLGSTSDQAIVSFGGYAKDGYGFFDEISYAVTDFELLRVPEGKGSKMKTYAVDEVLTVEHRENSSLMKISLPAPVSEAHTYKLWFRYAGAERSITVNVKPNTAVPSISVKAAKGYSGIDLADPGSEVAFAVTGKNCGINSNVIYNDVNHLYYEWKIFAPDGTDVTGYFDCDKRSDGLVYSITDSSASEALSAGKYKFSFKVYVGCASNEGYAIGSCTFPVRKSEVAGEPTIKLTLKGRLEAFISSGKNVTVTCKTSGLPGADVFWYTRVYSDAGCTHDMTHAFYTSRNTRDGIKYTDNISTHEAVPGDYYARIEYDRIEYDMDWNGTPDVYSNVVRFTVGASAPKVRPSVKEVSLTTRDCRRGSTVFSLSRGNFKQPLAPEMITIDPVSSAFFDIVTLEKSDGSLDMQFYWKDKKICLAPGTVKTVKIYVYCGGYNPLNPPAYKPATVTVKVRVK